MKNYMHSAALLPQIICFGFSIGFLIAVGSAKAEITPLEQLLVFVPKAAGEHNRESGENIRDWSLKVERWLVEENNFDNDISNSQHLEAVVRILKADAVIRHAINELYAQRKGFQQLINAEEQKNAVQGFLECMTALINLSGRLRYYSFDFFSDVAYELQTDLKAFDKLLDTFIEYKSSVGAITSLEFLAETLRDSTDIQFPDHWQGKILQLTRISRTRAGLPILLEMLSNKKIEPEFSIFLIDTIRHLGLPQLARPDADPESSPPVVDSAALLRILSDISAVDLSPGDALRHEQLTKFFTEHQKRGVHNDTFEFGRVVVQTGDWLLMKNPSPYNRFTDHYPGLFTHVGVVTTETGPDGKRRFVVVDLPEIGNTIPATPIDKFVERTLNFVILRHPDPAVQETMGRIANSIIGNDSKFDLNFRTDKIENMKGKDLRGKLIDGYCAGLLLLCAQETGKPLRDFFPLIETPAGGNTLQNLATLNVSMPSRFFSPTGPLFSSELNLVYQHETMYSPRRQIEQTIYDYFAEQMRTGELRPSLTWFHTLRLNLAEATKKNPILGKALANVAGINQNIDLVAAAKLGAVVETLDEIAQDASENYRVVRGAFRIDALDNIESGPAGDKRFDQIVMRRRRHSDLFVLWEAGVISPRDLRIALVDYYIAQGCKQLDDRFFSAQTKTVKNISDD